MGHEQAYSRAFLSIVNVNQLSLAELRLPELSPADDVLPLIRQYISVVVPKVSALTDSIATSVLENYTTCVSQKTRTQLRTSAPEDMFVVVRL